MKTTCPPIDCLQEAREGWLRCSAAGDEENAQIYLALMNEIRQDRTRAQLISYTREILAGSTDPAVSLQAIDLLAKLEGLY